MTTGVNYFHASHSSCNLSQCVKCLQHHSDHTASVDEIPSYAPGMAAGGFSRVTQFHYTTLQKNVFSISMYM